MLNYQNKTVYNQFFSIIFVSFRSDVIRNSKVEQSTLNMNNMELEKLRASTAKKHQNIREILDQPYARRLEGLIYYELNCKFSKIIFFSMCSCVCQSFS